MVTKQDILAGKEFKVIGSTTYSYQLHKYSKTLMQIYRASQSSNILFEDNGGILENLTDNDITIFSTIFNKGFSVTQQFKDLELVDME